MKNADRDFLKQLHWAMILDRLFRVFTPIFVAGVALAGIFAVFYKG